MSSRTAEPSAAPAGDRQASRGWSITRRLTVLYTLSALAMILAVTSAQYAILSRGIAEHETLLLVDKVRVLAHILDKAGYDAKIIEHEVSDEAGVYHPNQQYVFFYRVLDDQERIVAETPEMTGIVPVASFPAALPWSEVRRSVSSQPFHAADGRVFSLASVWTSGSGEPSSRRVIQAALEAGGEPSLMDAYRRDSFLVVVLSIVLFAMGGAAIARRGMRPVRDMARVTEQITVSQLNARFDPGQWPEELTMLAEAFSGMLVRLEDSFDRCQRCAEDLAHELRTPIQNLMGEAQVALSRKRTADEYHRILESSLEEYDRLSRMINELLFLARADNPTTAIVRERFDARRELDVVADYYDAEADEHGLTLSCEGQAWIDADPTLFRRTLNNLLSNALRHTPRDGRVRLAVRTIAGGHVEVEVSDTGCGIAQEHLRHLGTRFYRPDRTASLPGEGAGLGITIVKSIMALHGGSVVIESSEGQGTRVILRFPPAALPTASVVA